MEEITVSVSVQADKLSDWNDNVLATEATKGGSASEVTSDPNASITNRQGGLDPLHFRQFTVGDFLDECFSNVSNLPKDG